MNITELRKKIDEVVKTNGTQSITGASLNEVLNSMVETLDDVYILDFTAVDLQDLEEERIESIKFNSDKLYSALQEGKRVYLREQTDLNGVYPVGLYAEDFFYVVMMTDDGIYYATLPYSSEFTKGDVSYMPYLSKGWLDEKEREVNTIKENVNTLQDDVEEHGTSIESLETQVDSHDILIEDLQDNKVDKGDYAPSLTAGFADNLVSGDVVVDSEFNARQSGGGAISDGVARMEVLKGNSVVWNQKIKLAGSVQHESAGINFVIDAASGTVIANGTAAGGNGIYGIAFQAVKGHIYALLGCPQGGSTSTYMFYNQASAADRGNGVIYTETRASGTVYNVIRIAEGATVENLTFTPRIHDLTLMFGAGNEPTTIEEFYARKPIVEDEYAYNEGEVIHCNVDAVKSVGRNVWDEKWEVGALNATGLVDGSVTTRIITSFIRVLPNRKYIYRNYSSITYEGRWAFYDENKNLIMYSTSAPHPNSQFTTPANAAYMRYNLPAVYGSTYNHDIVFALADVGFDGNYVSYKEDIREIPTAIKEAFPEGMMSAGTAHDVAYNDLNKEVGVTEKRVGVVDMGTLRWNRIADGYYKCDFSAYTPHTSNLMCAKYITSKVKEIDKTIFYADNYAGIGQMLVIDSSFTDVASFKAAMSGVMLYYELAEPIVTEHDEPFNLDYQVTNGGQEEALSSKPTTPIKAEIAYGFNASAKIKENANEIAQLKATIAELQAALASMVNENVEDYE